MAGVNKVILLGRLGKDPETKEVTSGVKVTNFSIATSESYKDKEGNKQEKTEWHNVVCWNRLSDLAENYLEKGREVYLEGKIQTRSWDDKDGNKRYTTEIVATQMNFVGGKSDSANSPSQSTQEASSFSNDAGEDLPF